MTGLPEHLFTDPVRQSLATRHRHFAIGDGDALRYPADVAPFATCPPHKTAMQQLSSLLAPGESVWIFANGHLSIAGLDFERTLDCFQMVLPSNVAVQDVCAQIVPLDETHASEMIALTNIAFPGFFRARTCQMGSYFGVRNSDGALIAMAGERLMLDRYPEISGVCTHPDHRGRGLAAALIARLVDEHRRRGLVSWLHVSCSNQRAIELYQRFGFEIARKVPLLLVTQRG